MQTNNTENKKPRISKNVSCTALFGALLFTVPLNPALKGACAAPAAKPGLVGNAAGRLRHPNESWATPTLAGTRLTPQTPLVAETDDRPTFTREMVAVGWRPFDEFHLYVIKPKGIAKPPVVLYLYDYKNDTKRFLKDDYCERITRAGCAAVGFESALSADRFQMRPMKQWFVSELPEALAASAHDVQMVLNYLDARGDLDLGRVGMFGQGSGGSIAILAAGADPRIKALNLLNPWGNWPVWLKESAVVPDSDRARLTQPAFLHAAALLDPLQWLPRLAGRKIRLIQLKDDPVTPAACREALAKAAPTGTQVIEYDNGLALLGAQGQGRLFSWLAGPLGARPVPPPALPRQTAR